MNLLVRVHIVNKGCNDVRSLSLQDDPNIYVGRLARHSVRWDQYWCENVQYEQFLVPSRPKTDKMIDVHGPACNKCFENRIRGC